MKTSHFKAAAQGGVGQGLGGLCPRRAALTAVALLAALCLAGSAVAQDRKRESQLRTVRGTAVDKEESPIATAVVYLKNMKTRAVKTYITDDAGQFRFSGLDPNVDYEIHAEHQELVSSKRTISTFDSRKEIVLMLKVSKKREEKSSE